MSVNVSRALVRPALRLGPGSKLSSDDKQALNRYTREVEQVIETLVEAIEELQKKVNE